MLDAISYLFCVSIVTILTGSYECIKWYKINVILKTELTDGKRTPHLVYDHHSSLYS